MSRTVSIHIHIQYTRTRCAEAMGTNVIGPSGGNKKKRKRRKKKTFIFHKISIE